MKQEGAETADVQRIPSAPAVLPGFEHVNRYWDNGNQSHAAKILPGEYYVTCHDELVATVLGSCISACVRDRALGIGGMNHFMLPTGTDSEECCASTSLSAATRYGNFAMEHLINTILKHGGSRRNLEVKIFGGGRMMAGMTDIGRRNIEFIRDYLSTEGLQVAAEDLGDIYPRKVLYQPHTGRARIKRLRSLHNDTIVQRETRYLQELECRPVEGAVELFG